MLKIEVIKFEAQDIITSSGAEKEPVLNENMTWDEFWNSLSPDVRAEAEELMNKGYVVEYDQYGNIVNYYFPEE